METPSRYVVVDGKHREVFRQLIDAIDFAQRQHHAGIRIFKQQLSWHDVIEWDMDNSLDGFVPGHVPDFSK